MREVLSRVPSGAHLPDLAVGLVMHAILMAVGLFLVDRAVVRAPRD